MSIPKEPRQLMINLMYLVLTALLALNVSAEVMNAFFSLDKGLAGSRDIVNKSNEGLKKAIDKQTETYNTEINRKYQKAAADAQQVAADFDTYIASVRDELWQKAGGDNPKIPGQPKDIRNKDLTTRWFITEKKGAEIKLKIEETRNALLAFADNDPKVAESLTLGIDEIPPGVKAKTWEEFKFKQMPVAAVVPTLGKLRTDVKSSAQAILNYCLGKVKGEEIIFDKFIPVISPKKSYVIMGEKYEAEVFLSAFSSTASNVSLSVNGQGLSVVQGVAKYETTANSLGEKKVNVSAVVKNPLTGKSDSYSKEYSYEVGQRSVACAADKMNVFYIGVDNPISVSAAGVNSNEVKVSIAGGGGSLKSNGTGKYNVTVSTPTGVDAPAYVTVAAPGVSQKFPFRVKRIPDPAPLLGAKHKSGSMPNGEFKAQGGIAAVLENFDFDVRCTVAGFKAVYLAKRQDPVEYANAGAKWGGDVQGIINKARPGDTYFFDDIKVNCPGDAAGRNLGGLSFKIK